MPRYKIHVLIDAEINSKNVGTAIEARLNGFCLKFCKNIFGPIFEPIFYGS